MPEIVNDFQYLKDFSTIDYYDKQMATIIELRAELLDLKRELIRLKKQADIAINGGE